jgi:hypothetical protein
MTSCNFFCRFPTWYVISDIISFILEVRQCVCMKESGVSLVLYMSKVSHCLSQRRKFLGVKCLCTGNPYVHKSDWTAIYSTTY